MLKNQMLLSDNEFIHIDRIIRRPKKDQLTARQLVKPVTDLQPFDDHYGYNVETTTGRAKLGTDRQTDVPLVGVGLSKSYVPIVEYKVGLDYTYEEVARANAVGYSVLDAKANAAKRALAEFENQLIFNGKNLGKQIIDDEKLIGFTTDPKISGVQVADSEVHFRDTVGDEEKSEKLRDILQEASELISNLPGYTGAMPILCLPPKLLGYIKRPYNKYNVDTTVSKLISDFVRAILPVPELAAENNPRGEDMGLLLLNDPDIMAFPDAMRAQAMQAAYDGERTLQVYMQRTGGLILYQPKAVVQLTGI
ncbi:MAG: hypothetical protein [Bacteriophage sp.]|nr:MAG: hypothetical protein [Bacteriophage sp.]